MGEKNDAFCAYMEKADIFADFINGTVFGGRKEVTPEELEAALDIYHLEKRTGRSGGGRSRYQRHQDCHDRHRGWWRFLFQHTDALPWDFHGGSQLWGR